MCRMEILGKYALYTCQELYSLCAIYVVCVLVKYVVFTWLVRCVYVVSTLCLRGVYVVSTLCLCVIYVCLL